MKKLFLGSALLLVAFCLFTFSSNDTFASENNTPTIIEGITLNEIDNPAPASETLEIQKNIREGNFHFAKPLK